MKRITVILLSLILLLSILLQGCDDAQSAGDESIESIESTGEDKYRPVIKPMIVYSGEYNFNSDNLFRCPVLFDNGDMYKMPELGFPITEKTEYLYDAPLSQDVYLDKEYEKITELDLYGRKIPLVYQKTSVYWYGQVAHCFDKATFDQNGKILDLELDKQLIDTSLPVITQDQAMDYALKFIKDYTSFEANEYQVSVSLPDKYNKYYRFCFKRIFDYVKTNEHFDIEVSQYDGTVLDFDSTYSKLFANDLVLNIDKDGIESAIRERIEALHNGIILSCGYEEVDYIITRYSPDNVEFEYCLKTADDGTLFLEIFVKSRLELVYYDYEGNVLDRESPEDFVLDEFDIELYVFHIYQDETTDSAE